MVNKVGLLPTARANQVWPAFQSFARQGKDTWAHSAAFCKENESRRIVIEFVGVWCVSPSSLSTFARRGAPTPHY